MKVNKLRNYKKAWLSLCVFVACQPAAVFAMTAPEKTAFAYPLYDVAVNSLLKGPIGFVGGIAVIVASAATITKNWMLALMGIIGGTAIIKADTIVATMGMMVDAL